MFLWLDRVFLVGGVEVQNSELLAFLSRFRFREDLAGCVGVEREHFVASLMGYPVPQATSFLAAVHDPRWTHELSACQVEVRTRPHRDLSALKLELLENENIGRHVAKQLDLLLINVEVGDKDMPLNVYPDPRYLKIAGSIPAERLSAACRVAGTHIHIGVGNMRQAIAVYNSLVPHLEELCRLGDHSAGERLKLYKTMAIDWLPKPYEGVEHFFEVARTHSFEVNPRDCWQLIRISVHGTVELRMFGVTNHVDEVLWWVSRIRAMIQPRGEVR